MRGKRSSSPRVLNAVLSLNKMTYKIESSPFTCTLSTEFIINWVQTWSPNGVKVLQLKTTDYVGKNFTLTFKIDTKYAIERYDKQDLDQIIKDAFERLYVDNQDSGKTKEEITGNFHFDPRN